LREQEVQDILDYSWLQELKDDDEGFLARSLQGEYHFIDKHLKKLSFFARYPCKVRKGLLESGKVREYEPD